MHAVILTFPGHFFQTQLCVSKMLEHYPEISSLSFILDDVQSSPWHSYQDDFMNTMANLVDRPWQVFCSSDMRGIKDCVAGWWRQQLIKLTIDNILSDQEWFVVDGDVIFLSRCEIRGHVPISRCSDLTSRWSQMCVNYVKDTLGTNQGIMHDRCQPVITSAIPFRYLDRDLLQALRSHVESRFPGNFVDLHLRWFQDQTIVADIDPPTRWVMSEWELIECFRRMVQHRELPYRDIGSGYQIDASLEVFSGCEIFLHSYQRDPEIGRQWFEGQGLVIADQIWCRSETWYHDREGRRIL